MVLPETFPSGPFRTNTYLFACPETRLAAVIDAAPGSTPAIRSYLETNGYHPIYILLTHTHWDHIADITALRELYDVTVYVHAWDRPNLESPGVDGLSLPIKIAPVVPDHELAEGDIIEIGNLSLRVIHTPGHSPGSVCFYAEHDRFLLSGDTVFKGTIGNLSFSSSRPDLISHSLDKLAQLPFNTLVFPGHGPVTTIGMESPSWESFRTHK